MIQNKEQFDKYLDSLIEQLDSFLLDFNNQADAINSQSTNNISIDIIEKLYQQYKNKVQNLLDKSKPIIINFIISHNKNNFNK
jgi:hypothetical protein